MPGYVVAGHSIQVDDIVRMERGRYGGVERLIIFFRKGRPIRIEHNPANGVDINVIEADIRAKM
jgi:hypothetical protein